MADLAPRIREMKAKVHEFEADRLKLDAGGAPVVPLLGEAASRHLVSGLHQLLEAGSISSRRYG